MPGAPAAPAAAPAAAATPAPADPNAIQAPLDPTMGAAPMEDPAMAAQAVAPADPTMADPAAAPDAQAEAPEEPADDSTESIISGLSDEDKEAVRKYALAISRDNGDLETPEAEQPAAPMAESYIFTKKQLSEVFGMKGQKDDNRASEKGKKNLSSPFSAPVMK